MYNGYDRLIEKVKKLYPSSDITLLQKAFESSTTAHLGQHRVSGDPYIMHPVEVAIILADMELDLSSIVAGVLHDTIEDTTFTYEKIVQEFGLEIAHLVDGVTKLGKLQYKSKVERQAENLRKMFLAMASDIRVILIKLADRLHNMRTLKYMPEEKQIEKATETLEIFAPLAHRLGISKIKWELEDLCLRFIDPKGYYELVDKISVKRKERENYIHTILDTLKVKITELEIDANIDGRPKHFFSIYKKMKEQNKTLDQIYDLFAVRVLVNTVKDCYTILGLVHELYKPLPGRFKDYIAMPKPNMYQSLHTTLLGPEGNPFEIQIRTYEMHQVAEMGIAAHWRYKDIKADDKGTDLDTKLSWLRQLVDWQKEMPDADEFMETLRIDLFTDEVFVFTPRGDVINLRKGSCPIDFAYAIHSAVGNKLMGAKINGRIVPLEYELKNGDIVEILTQSNVQGPSRDWLKIAKTSQARNKINQWFKKERKEENVIKGKELLDREVKKTGIPPSQLLKSDWLDLAAKKFNFNNTEELYAGMSLNAVTPNRVLSKLKDELRKVLKPDELALLPELVPQIKKPQPQNKRVNHDHGISVKGIENCLVRLSRCCNPVPGDNITGYITRGRGVSVHISDCPNVTEYIDGENRLIEVSWYNQGSSSYVAEISIFAIDRAALILEISNVFAESKMSMRSLNARTTKDHVAIVNISMDISNSDQLDKIIKKLRRINGISEISRTKQ